MRYRIDIPFDRFPPSYARQVEDYRRLGIDAVRFLSIAFEFFSNYGMPGLHPYRFLRERVFQELQRQQPDLHPDRLQHLMHSLVDHIGLIEQTVITFLVQFTGTFDFTFKVAQYHGNTVAIYFTKNQDHGYSHLSRSPVVA